MQSTMSWPRLCSAVAVLPGVAAVEQQRASLAFRADRFEHGGDAIESSEPAVALGECREILRGERIRRRAARRNAVMLEQRAAGQVRHKPARGPDAEIDRGLTEVQRQELGVDVGDVEERDIADRLEAQQVGLRKPLLGEGAGPAARQHRSRGRSELNKVTPGNHVRCPYAVIPAEREARVPESITPALVVRTRRDYGFRDRAFGAPRNDAGID
jgi:hypothetical protein